MPLEQRIGGAPRALADAGLTSADILTFRQNDKHSAEQRKAFISKFLEMIDSAALCKWDLIAQSTGRVPGNSSLNFKPDEKGRVVGGHETMLSKKDLELVKDPNTGEVLDVYFRVTGAHWKGDLGVSKARYSLVKDFLEPGNNLTLATLKPEILSAIANNDAQKIAVNNK